MASCPPCRHLHRQASGGSTETELPEDSVEAEVDETDALSAPSADLAEDADGGTEDIVGNIIWNLETAQKNKPEPLPEPEIPLGRIRH